MKDFVPPDHIVQPIDHPPDTPTILVIGTSMSCGKSCTARVIIRTLKEMGIKELVAAKLTGAGYFNDILGFSDAGADTILDFVDVGLPSTLITKEEYRQSLHKMFGLIASRHPEVIVIEAGASPVESYNGQLVLEAYYNHPNLMIILCANDAYAVLGATQYMKPFNLSPSFVSGVIANTRAGRDLVLSMTGFPASGLNDDKSVEDFTIMLKEVLPSLHVKPLE
jgi:hypothetical protein